MPGVELALTRAAVRGRLKVSNDTGRNWATRGKFPGGEDRDRRGWDLGVG